MRAGRVLWADRMRGRSGPMRKAKCSARTQTSGWSLTAQDPWNNVARTTIEALSATMGACNLHTNSLDEAIALPTDMSARIARNTQFFSKPRPATAAVDPWAGSHVLEDLTAEMIVSAETLMAEIAEKAHGQGHRRGLLSSALRKPRLKQWP